MTPPNVLVFGATSAIAQEVMRILAARRAGFVLVGRDRQRLRDVAVDLHVRGASRADLIVADLDVVGEFPDLVGAAVTLLERIDVVLVAQGVLGSQRDAEASPAEAARILHANLVAPALLLQEAANRLAEQRSGTLVAISSVAGDRGRQSNYFYGAAKGGLSVFLAGLRNRLHPLGVHVLTVKPGFVDTPMTAGVPKNALFASPERVARGIVRALDRRADVAYVPGFWRAIMLAVRAVPEALFKRLRL